MEKEMEMEIPKLTRVIQRIVLKVNVYIAVKSTKNQLKVAKLPCSKKRAHDSCAGKDSEDDEAVLVCQFCE